MHFKYQSFKIELQLESIMENSTKLFVCFLIAVGIQCTGACVRENYSRNKNLSTYCFCFKNLLFVS